MTSEEICAMPLHDVRQALSTYTMRWASRRAMGHTTLPLEVQRLEDRERLAWLIAEVERHE